MNNPIMYVDPTGHFTIGAMIISISINLAFELIEDLMGDGKIGGDKDGWDYLGAVVSGIFGGLSPVGGTKTLQIASQVLFSFAGGMADAAISGDLSENGFWNTAGSIAVSTGLSMFAGSISKYATSKIKAGKLMKLGSNNAVNKALGKMDAVGKIGTKKKTELASMIMGSEWIGNIISEYGASSIMGGISSMGWSHIFDGRWF